MNTKSVTQQCKVWLQFSLSLDSGELIDSCFEQDPVSMVMGEGSMLPSFEAALLGMSAGEQSQFRIAAADAFGLHNEDNVQFFSPDQFGDESLELGLVMNFADAANGEVPGVIVDINDERVTVDFNHPLAGKDIVFDVKIDRIDAIAN